MNKAHSPRYNFDIKTTLQDTEGGEQRWLYIFTNIETVPILALC
jgi:hypothetical protein